ncbi:MAG: helix-turn-helix domain-containing protein [Ferruginibacter sp.]
MKNNKAGIPKYNLKKFRPIHRQEDNSSSFGYNQIEKFKIIEGFEIYSSEGLIGSIGPLKSEFYRVSITVSGTLDMQIGLEHYQHKPGTICFTYPNQIIAKSNGSTDLFGYYILFNIDFLNDIIPSVKIAEEFPFYNLSGIPLFQLSEEELDNIVTFVLEMNKELQELKTGRIQAMQMYLYLILINSKRSYERQQLQAETNKMNNHGLVSRFRKLVSLHYLSKRKVSDYAKMLAVSSNHLNRIVKQSTAQTASNTIKEMLAPEAKALLRYTDNSITEIAYKLDFSDPASFNRFFKTTTMQTPLTYRNRYN